jgi:glycosyltransferase involved in cell wall biosynthesis
MGDGPLRLALRLPDEIPEETGDSVVRVNSQIARVLRSAFEVVAPPEADLEVWAVLAPEPHAGAPRLLMCHGALGDPGHWLRSVPKLRVGDTLAAHSRTDLDLIARLGGTPFCRVELLPLFVDTSCFVPLGADRDRLRARFGLPPRVPLLLSAGRVYDEKNVHGALHLLAALHRAGARAHLAVAGDGPGAYRAYLEQLSERLAVRGFVHFVGAQGVAALNELYNAADLLVHLSLVRKENFGLVPLEAQAAGLPVLSSHWGGLRDLVRPGQTGFYARTWLVRGERRVDWAGLVEPCLDLLRDAPRRAAFGRQARAHVEAEYAPAPFRARLLALLDRWAASPPSAAALARRVALSEAAKEMVFIYALVGREHPEAEDSFAISRLLQREQHGTFAYRAIHACMATSAEPPELPEPDDRRPLYRLVDFESAAAGRRVILEPPWDRSVALGEAAAWLLAYLQEGPAALPALRDAARGNGLAEPELSLAVRELLDEGLVGVAGPPTQ